MMDAPQKPNRRFTIRGMLLLIAWLVLAFVYARDYDIFFHSGYSPADPGQIGFGNRFFSGKLERNDREKITVWQDGEQYVTLVDRKTLRFLGVQDNETGVFEEFIPYRRVQLSVGGKVIEPLPEPPPVPAP